MTHSIKNIAIGAALFTLGGAGCGGGGGGDSSGPLSNVDALVFLQRPKRIDGGDIFAYDSYKAGARIVKLSPPTADGKLTALCCDKAGSEFSAIDISSFDLSFDAQRIVFAGKLSGDDRYGLYLLQLADGSVKQLASDPMRDYIEPIWMPGDKVMFMTNQVAGGALQHQDEYERRADSQVAVITVGQDGTSSAIDDGALGPRNLSHRTSPSMASDGRVIFTQWDHLGEMNAGHLMFMNQDMQNLREGFGKEGSGVSDSTLKAREVSPGRFVAIATARDRTLNAGAIIDIRLGKVETHDGAVSAPTLQSEANATVQELTPDVPRDNTASAPTVGRYYDAFPLNAKDKPDLLVSWADGFVETSTLSSAGVPPNFSIYVYNSEHQQRQPIFDDPDMWDIYARPLAPRSAPNPVASATDPRLLTANQGLIGSLNVYDSSLHQFAQGEIYGVRVEEGFSGEEGVRTFGTTMFEGHATLGVAPVQADGSWSAKVPPNTPLHLQAIDKFGASLFNEPVWFSVRPGEARVCGGCHEDRTRATTVSPGLLDAFVAAENDLFSKTPLYDRMKLAPASATEIVGVPWGNAAAGTKTVQQVLDAHCVESCHDANNSAGLAPAFTITLPTDPTHPISWTLNLTGDPVPDSLAAIAGMGKFSASYLSVAGPDMEAVGDANITISPANYTPYMLPMNARGSSLIAKINPPQLFPTPGTARMFDGVQPHLLAKGKPDMTAQEYYTLILAADVGVNFFSRENNPAPVAVPTH